MSNVQKAINELQIGLEEERYSLTEKYWRVLIASEITLAFMPSCVCEKCGTIQTGALVADIVGRIANGR
jgi:hypothetical protein